VASLKPSDALCIEDLNVTVKVAAKSIAEVQGRDSALVAANGKVIGILTDTDVCRSIARGEDPGSTPVIRVMTNTPQTVAPMSSALSALRKMVECRFRHLPVEDSGTINGMLLLTKCVTDIVKKIEGGSLTEAWQNDEDIVSLMRFGDTALSTICAQADDFLQVSYEASLLDAISLMAEAGKTYVLVSNRENALDGIFTSKDVMLRVVAQEKSLHTSIVGHYSPGVTTIDESHTVLDALIMMCNGKRPFMHLPVRNEDTQDITGVVDMRQLAQHLLGSHQEDGNNRALLDHVCNLRDFHQEHSEDGSLRDSISEHMSDVQDNAESQLLGMAPKSAASTFLFKVELTIPGSTETRWRSFQSVLQEAPLREHLVTELSKLEDPRGPVSPGSRLAAFEAASMQLGEAVLFYEDEDSHACEIRSDEDVLAAANLACTLGNTKVILLLKCPGATGAPAVQAVQVAELWHALAGVEARLAEQDTRMHELSCRLDEQPGPDSTAVLKVCEERGRVGAEKALEEMQMILLPSVAVAGTVGLLFGAVIARVMR